MQVLQQLQPRIRDLLQQRQLQMRLQGLQYMNDEPGAVHVIFMGVQDAPAGSGEHASVSELQLVCKEVLKAFDAEGLLLPRDSRCVLTGLPFNLSATLSLSHKKLVGRFRNGQQGAEITGL